MGFCDSHAYLPLPLLLSALFGAGGCAPAQDATLPVLTTVRQVRAMDAGNGERGYPVRLQGIVTYYHAQSKSLIVQAGSEGVFVDTGKTQVPVTPGQAIAIEGSTGPGESSVIVIANRLTVVKAGTMPAVGSGGPEHRQLEPDRRLAASNRRSPEVSLSQRGQRFLSGARATG